MYKYVSTTDIVLHTVHHQNPLFCSTDIDECQLGSDSCAKNADCLDTEGSYMCTCSIGFTGDGLSNCDSELLITICTYLVNSYILFSHQM